jgi:aryl-alcohol dehydrogenase-like predicted oxidoreductase
MSSTSAGTEQIRLSRLGLGTVQFGFDYGVNNTRGQVPYDEVCNILTSASDQGVNFLDTSRLYGASESVLGKAVAEIGRDFTICTKLDLPSNFSELSEKEIGEAVNTSFMGSCESLQLNTLPMYLLHNFDYKTTHGGYAWSLLKDMKAKGLIGKLGVSIGRGPDEALQCLQDPDVEVMQIPFNVFDQRWKRAGVLSQCREKGIELINRSTYLQGLLLMSVEKATGLVPVSRERVKKLLEIAETANIPVKELVFKYVLENPNIKTTIVGVDSIEQLEENIRLQNMGPIKPEIIQSIETAFLDSPDELVNPALWNIAYP